MQRWRKGLFGEGGMVNWEEEVGISWAEDVRLFGRKRQKLCGGRGGVSWVRRAEQVGQV